MANIVYPKWKVARANAQTPDMDAVGTNIKAVLVDTGAYSYNAAHEFLSDIPSGARIATSPNLSGKAIDNTTGVLNADDFAFPTVSGVQSEAIVFYVDTGDPATSRLWLYIDTATGLPVTPNGLDINVVLNASGIAIP